MLFAHKCYSSGDLIVEAKPFIYALHSKFKSRLCDACFRSSDGKTGNNLKACSRCRRCWYCDKNCQTFDWQLHKYECQLFFKNPNARFPNEGEASILPLFLRTVMLFQAKPELVKKKHQLFNLTEVSFDDLMAHEDHINRVYKELLDRDFKMFEQIFRINFGSDERRWFCQLYINSYEIYMPTDEGEENAGKGLSFDMLKFNHSCAPSAFEAPNCRPNIKLMAAKEIIPGDELTIAYYDVISSVEKRQKIAEQHYNFQCNCLRCHNGDELDSTGKIVDYDLINQFCLTPISDNHTLKRCCLQLGNDDNVLDVINKIFPFHQPGKTNFLVRYVKVANRLNRGMLNSVMVRAAMKELKITHPSEEVKKFDVKNGDVRKMLNYLLSL